MKLYTTVTSERATKGQGGNKQLDIDILVYDRMNPRYHITVTEDKLIFTERGYSAPLLERSHKYIKEQYEKGKKQKDERSKKCSNCASITKTSLPNWHCSNCGHDN